MVGILKGIKSDASTENNTKAFSVLIAFAGGVWCKLYICAVSYLCLTTYGCQCYALCLGSS